MRRGTVISVVTPVYNEKGSVGPLLRELAEAFEKLSYEFELIIVNDGSDAVTTEILDRVCDEDDRVGVVHLSRNFGHQAALSAGIDEADGDAVLVMDADLQHPVAVIPVMIREWEAGFDVVHAVRRIEKSATVLKRTASRGFYRLFNFLSDTHIPANGADFRLMDRSAVDALKTLPERTRFLRGLSNWIGFSQTQVPYNELPRHSGIPKYSLRKQIGLGIEGITSMSTRPLSFLFGAGVMLTIGALVGLAALIATPLIEGIPVDLAPVTLASIAALGGLILTAIGIVGLYVGAVHREVQGRPLYLIRRRKGLVSQRRAHLREASRR
jgi:dolichol-phosphate mannosyltransferase